MSECHINVFYSGSTMTVAGRTSTGGNARLERSTDRAAAWRLREAPERRNAIYRRVNSRGVYIKFRNSQIASPSASRVIPWLPPGILWLPY